MPELPEVETVKRGLLAHIKNARMERVLVRFGQLRSPIPDNIEQVMEGATITDITRRSKYMLWELSNGFTMLSHLGMSGRFNMYDTPPEVYKKHEHVVWFLADGRVLAYEDPRRFGVIDVMKNTEAAQHKLLASLGPEPLSRQFSARYLQAALAKRKQAIKPVLMDAKLVVGVGNIYASEACFRAGIDPHRPASDVAKSALNCNELAAVIKQVLKEAIDSGGSSLRDFWHVEGGGGYFQHRFFVYGRDGEDCLQCDQTIEFSKQAGRSTFFCKKCQNIKG